MKKVTVNEAVAAIQSADSKEAMQTILEQCTKSVMIQVYEAVTGQPESFKASLRKSELARNVADRIQVWRENEEFKAKSFDEKYEILTTCPNHCDRITYAYKFTVEELQATVLRLGIPARYDEGEEFDPWAKDILADDVIKELKAREAIAEIEELMNGDDAVALKNELRRTHPDTLRRLLDKYGVSCEDDRTIYGVKMVNALYEYYLSGRHVVTEDEAEANLIEEAASYFMEHAELEASLLTEDERRHNEQVIAEAQARVELAAEYEDDAAIWSREELENIAEELGLETCDWMSNAELITSIVMKDACMYDGLLAEKEHMMLEESLSSEAQAEVENIYLSTKEAIRTMTWTREQCRLISDLKAEIKSKGLKDGSDDMTVSQYIWGCLETNAYSGAITWAEADEELREFLRFFGVEGIETLETMDYLALIDCVSYWIGEHVYNESQVQIEATPVEYSAAIASQPSQEDVYKSDYDPLGEEMITQRERKKTEYMQAWLAEYEEPTERRKIA